MKDKIRTPGDLGAAIKLFRQTEKLPEKIRQLDVNIGGERRGELLKQSQLLFKYAADDPEQLAVGLLMPPSRLILSCRMMDSCC